MLLAATIQSVTVNQQVLFSTNNVPVGEQATLILYTTATGSSQTFQSNANGYFQFDVADICYDVVIKKYVDGNLFEWYQQSEWYPNLGYIESNSIVINSNPDKILIVPNDYTTIQDAINHIQDTGTVLIQDDNYIVSGLNWKHKHIKLQGESISGVIFDNDDWVSAIKLDWSGINNQDIIQNINFTNCLFDQANDSRGPALALYNGASPQIISCNFTNNINKNSFNDPGFSNAYGVGGAVYVGGIVNQINTPKFNYCNFTNNQINEANGGGAVALYGRAIFQGCNFTGNKTAYYNEIQGSGGAILIFTRDYAGDILFNACQFINNKSVIAAHDVYIAKCDNMSQIKFDGCTFSWSPTHYYNSLPSVKFLPDSGVWNQHSNLVIKNSKFTSCDLGVLYFNDYQGGNGLTFTGNVVANNCAQYCNGNGYGVYLKYYLSAPINPDYFKFDNNTISNIDGYGLILYEGADYTINNSVFENCSTAGISWNQGNPNNTTESLTTNYCLFTSSTPRYDMPVSSNPLIENSVQSVESINLDSNYTPIWNAEIKSLCIDSGNPDTDGDGIPWYDDPDDQDFDGTRPNIGALLLEDGHKNGAILLKESEEWNWICIPAIDYPGGPRGTDHIDYVFDTYQDNNLFINTGDRILNRIKWLYNFDIGSVFWDVTMEPEPAFVFPLETHHVRAQYGYKINLDTTNPILPEITPVEYTGFLPGGTGNQVNGTVIEPTVEQGIGCFFNDHTQTWERETWLGYYKEESLEPFDALAPILNNIVSIKTQEWSIDRVIEDGSYTNQWYGFMTSEANLAFNYGEAIVVRYIGNEQAEFMWGDTYPIPPELPRYERPEPEVFTFVQKEDYLPVYATLDFSNLPPDGEPVEIAIYVDGECVGAEVTKSTEMQIKAYLDTDDMAQFHDKVVEFVLYSPSKNENQIIKKFAIQNPETNLYEIRNSIPENCQNYMKVSLKPQDIADAQAPALTKLGNNYPNPFNPDTTIRFDLAKSGKAKLEIFNIKGQLIKSLVNDKMEAGFHSIKWNGRDENGKQASSGVYFYRLTSGGKSLTNKMLMLK